ncbi:MAG: hypothetical protein RR588_06005 [Solibacillus sp.]
MLHLFRPILWQELSHDNLMVLRIIEGESSANTDKMPKISIKANKLSINLGKMSIKANKMSIKIVACMSPVLSYPNQHIIFFGLAHF